MYACVKGRDAVAAMLLQAGADVHMRDARGGTALHLATMLGHPPLVQRLLLAGAPPPPPPLDPAPLTARTPPAPHL